MRIEQDIPLDQAALFGCAMLTGVGAAINTADVRADQSVVVVGLADVGLTAVRGALAASTAGVLVVDPVEQELALALALEPGVTGASQPAE